MIIEYHPASDPHPHAGFTTVTDDLGVVHLLHDGHDIADGIYPVYYHPGGHIALYPDGQAIMRQRPERLYSRDGTSPGATYVGTVTIGTLPKNHS